MARKQKLELMWIGKENRPKLEPRILIENPEFSYHAESLFSEDDIFDNMLIHGDNLLALKALELEYTGKIKCIYIDPPYNTGSAFEHYDDGVEHSLWLTLIRDRLEILWNLLSDDGSIWINIDYNEVHYLKVLCDECFGRKSFVNEIIWQKRTSRENRKAIGSAHDTILLYTKKEPRLWKQIRNPLAPNASGLSNPDNDPRGPWTSVPFSAQGFRTNQMYDIETPTGVVHTPPKGRCWGATEEVYKEYLKENKVYFPKKGNGIPRIKQFAEDQKGLVPMTVWLATEVGTTEMSKKEILNLFPDIEPFGTPKPERLIERIIHIATNPGDIVLDSFLGSGTTAAVAHKMGRKWIGVELGEHCYTHCVPRLKQVVDGTDQGGISRSRTQKETVKLCDDCKDSLCEDCAEKVGKNDKGGELLWKGGGGFRFFELGPSLISEDRWGNSIINPDFNPAMLAEAMCKLEGFTYAPSDQFYWMHGSSTETDFIYVTTQFMNREMLTKVSDEVGSERSLLVCCTAFKCDPTEFPNLTVKKIPKAVLKKCEWGHDDYSLAVENLPEAPPEPEPKPEQPATASAPKRKFGKENTQQASLFDLSQGDE